MAPRQRERIQIGILYSQTGYYGVVGREMLNGVALAVEQVNASEAYDFRLEPVALDPGGDLGRYQDYCEHLIRERGVQHIIGCYTSASRKQVLPLIEKHDRLLWHSARYEGFENSDNVIYVGAAPNQHIVPLARYMIDAIGTDVYCVGSNYIWTWETTRVLQEIVIAAGGRMIAKRLLALGDTDIDHIIQEIVDRRPPVIFNTLVGETSYRFHRVLHRARQELDLPAAPVLSCSLCEPELRLIGPEASIGHITSSVYFASIDTPENRSFVRGYQTAFGQDNLPSVDAEAAYLCGLLLAQAIQRAGTADVHGVRDAAYLEEIRAPQGLVRIDPNNNHCYLTPRLGRSRSGFGFDIIDTASAPVKPDPYLTWLDIEAVSGQPRSMIPKRPHRQRPNLRVIK